MVLLLATGGLLFVARCGGRKAVVSIISIAVIAAEPCIVKILIPYDMTWRRSQFTSQPSSASSLSF